MPGRPGASGKERPGLTKYRFLIKIIKKINGFECRGDRGPNGQERPGLKMHRFLIKINKKINGFEYRGRPGASGQERRGLEMYRFLMNWKNIRKVTKTFKKQRKSKISIRKSAEMSVSLLFQ